MKEFILNGVKVLLSHTVDGMAYYIVVETNEMLCMMINDFNKQTISTQPKKVKTKTVVAKKQTVLEKPIEVLIPIVIEEKVITKPIPKVTPKIEKLPKLKKAKETTKEPVKEVIVEKSKDNIVIKQTTGEFDNYE